MLLLTPLLSMRCISMRRMWLLVLAPWRLQAPMQHERSWQLCTRVDFKRL